MGLDSKGRSEPGFDMHVFICGHSRPEDAVRPNCCSKNSLGILTELKKKVRESGVKGIRVQKSGCLDFCENGISCVVYPEGTWYSLSGEENIPDLLHHLKSGKVAEHLKMNLED